MGHVSLVSLKSLLMSDTRGRGYANAFYGVADYLALPIGMLLAAPFLLRHLGTGSIWSLDIGQCGRQQWWNRLWKLW